MDNDDIQYVTISSGGSSFTSNTIGTYSLPTSSSYTITNGGYATPTYTTSGTSSSWITGTGNVNITADGITMPSSGDIKIGDKSLKDVLSKIEDRMAILTPDPKKLEKFAALKKAYDNYKLIEKLCQEEDEL